MVALKRLVGDSLGGVIHDFWPDGKSYDQTVFEANKPVRAEDLTLIEQTVGIKLRDHIASVISSGWTAQGGLGFSTVLVGGVSTPLPPNSFALGDSWVNCRGHQVHVGNPDNVADLPALANYTLVQLAPPPSSGTASDYVYLEVWAQEVAGVGSTDNGGINIVDRNLYKWGGIGNGTYANEIYWTIADTNDPVEPVRRVQIRWALRSYRGASFAAAPVQGGATSGQAFSWTAVETITGPDGSTPVVPVYRAGDGSTGAASALNTTTGYTHLVPLGVVARSAGVTNIPSTAFTDARISVALNSNVVVNNTNIHPAVQIDPNFGHLGTAHFTYQGAPAASVASDAQTIVHLYQGAYATQFTLRRANTTQAEGTGTVFGPIRYLSLPIFAVGSGADVTVEIHADASNTPAGLLATATVPAAWVTAAVRPVNFYVNLPGLAEGGVYWLKVTKGGSAGNHVALMANATLGANAPLTLLATDGTTYASSPVSIAYTIYTGTGGSPVFAFVNGETLYVYEYNADGLTSAIGEYYTPPNGQGVNRAHYSPMTYDPTGIITDIG